ncbi:MAG: hypothetical protein JRJ29_22435 [Deltaproteobacteria bacterium]|nr:hypothetical protein [Deltaproteobacteria bacterium]
MGPKRVLIVSDELDRKNFLEFHVRLRSLRPVWYPNILSARLALKADPFALAIVDLGIPVEPKLELIKQCNENRPELPVVSIGKTEYLSQILSLASFASLTCLDSIQSVPDFLEERILC